MTLFAKFKRCFYEISKDLLDEKGRSTKLGPRQYLDILAFFGTFRVLFATYIMYTDYKTPDWAPWYDFRRHDVLVGFPHTFRTTFDYTIILMVYFFVIVYFLLEWWCFKLDAGTRNWRFWYQLTVVSQDDYYRFRLDGNQRKHLKAITAAKYEQKIEVYLPSVGLFLAPVKGAIAKSLALVEIAYRMEDVDVLQMQARPLQTMPLLSWSIRARALQVMILADYFAYAFQLIIGERLDFDTFNKLNIFSIFSCFILNCFGGLL